MQIFLASDEFIDWRTPNVKQQAAELAGGVSDPVEIARRCFVFVRDEIKHSGDHRDDRVTCRASDVLGRRTGWCFAKRHLLARESDPRGNKPGVHAEFRPPEERLAFSMDGAGERDLPEIGPAPHPAVVNCLFSCANHEQVCQNLPDIAALPLE